MSFFQPVLNRGCWLFVSLDGGNIAVLRRDNGRVELEHTVKVQGHPLGIALTPDGKSLMVTSVDFRKGGPHYCVDQRRRESDERLPECYC
jgi:hypothetical protein